MNHFNIDMITQHNKFTLNDTTNIFMMVTYTTDIKLTIESVRETTMTAQKMIQLMLFLIFTEREIIRRRKIDKNRTCR